MCIPFPHPFVAASSSRHPLSSAVGASQFSPGREAGYPTPPNPYRHSDRSDPAFSSARFLGAGSRREDRRPIPRILRDESLFSSSEDRRPPPRPLRALNLSASFVAASSSRHPPSSAGGASQFNPGREAWVPRTTQPQPSFRPERPGFFLPPGFWAPGRVERTAAPSRAFCGMNLPPSL